jgi:hypothetical protein
VIPSQRLHWCAITFVHWDTSLIVTRWPCLPSHCLETLWANPLQYPIMFYNFDQTVIVTVITCYSCICPAGHVYRVSFWHRTCTQVHINTLWKAMMSVTGKVTIYGLDQGSIHGRIVWIIILNTPYPRRLQEPCSFLLNVYQRLAHGLAREPNNAPPSNAPASKAMELCVNVGCFPS